jgi:hypothetical protein
MDGSRNVGVHIVHIRGGKARDWQKFIDEARQKITLREIKASGPRRPLVYCGDYGCAHSVVIDSDRRPDDVRLSDLEPLFVCQACGHRGADVRPLFEYRAGETPT